MQETCGIAQISCILKVPYLLQIGLVLRPAVRSLIDRAAVTVFDSRLPEKVRVDDISPLPRMRELNLKPFHHLCMAFRIDSPFESLPTFDESLHAFHSFEVAVINMLNDRFA